jgi:hypothetical protein
MDISNPLRPHFSSSARPVQGCGILTDALTMIQDAGITYQLNKGNMAFQTCTGRSRNLNELCGFAEPRDFQQVHREKLKK